MPSLEREATNETAETGAEAEGGTRAESEEEGRERDVGGPEGLNDEDRGETDACPCFVLVARCSPRALIAEASSNTHLHCTAVFVPG